MLEEQPHHVVCPGQAHAMTPILLRPMPATGVHVSATGSYLSMLCRTVAAWSCSFNQSKTVDKKHLTLIKTCAHQNPLTRRCTCPGPQLQRSCAVNSSGPQAPCSVVKTEPLTHTDPQHDQEKSDINIQGADQMSSFGMYFSTEFRIFLPSSPP